MTKALLRNIYRAFDYRSEDEVYDALADSATGPLLNKIYLLIQKGLVIQEQGGAVSHVNAVRMIDNQVKRSWFAPDGSARLTIACRWQVTGSVEHWGHIHTRENEYEALLTLSAATGHWKLIQYDLLDEKRLQAKTKIRT
jgi:hypothetical protein